MMQQVLPVGLHFVDCELFVAQTAPTRLEFRVEFQLQGTQ
jgi:hypothetical protein